MGKRIEMDLAEKEYLIQKCLAGRMREGDHLLQHNLNVCDFLRDAPMVVFSSGIFTKLLLKFCHFLKHHERLSVRPPLFEGSLINFPSRVNYAVHHHFRFCQKGTPTLSVYTLNQ